MSIEKIIEILISDYDRNVRKFSANEEEKKVHNIISFFEPLHIVMTNKRNEA